MILACESLVFEDVHSSVLQLLPKKQARVLDIGSGSGRDAAAFAAMGHSVIAIEPVAELRTCAKSIHPASNIEWIDDHLPELMTLKPSRSKFDVIMLHAVWMHLNEKEREVAMRRIAELTAEQGVALISLRHGPVPSGKRMFEVSARETIELAMREGLICSLHLKNQPSAFPRAEVTWTRLAFTRNPKSLPTS